MKGKIELDLSPLFEGRDKVTIAEARNALQAFAEAQKINKSGLSIVAKVLHALTPSEHCNRTKMSKDELEILDRKLVPLDFKIECDFTGGTAYCEPCDSYCCCFWIEDPEGYPPEEICVCE